MHLTCASSFRPKATLVRVSEITPITFAATSIKLMTCGYNPLINIYKALQLSVLTYVAPAWRLWTVPSRIEQLERCQKKPEGGDRITQIRSS